MKSDKEKPLFSFLLFAYNQEKYIREAVLGALNQTYSPLEIVISDDCSTDRTWEIIQQTVSEYTGPHKIIVNRNERNSGWARHINKAVKLTHGQWIVVAAGDDVSCTNRVQMIHDVVFSREDVFYVGTAVTLIDEEGRHCGDGPIEFSAVIRLPGCMSVYRRDCFAQFGELDARILTEDFVLPFRALLLGKLALVDRPTVRYRITTADYYESYKKYARFRLAIPYAYAQRERDLDIVDSPHPKDVLAGLKRANDEIIRISASRLKDKSKVIEFYDAPLVRRLQMLSSMTEMDIVGRVKLLIQSFATLRRLRCRVKKALSKPKHAAFTGAVAEFSAQDLLDMKIRIQGFNCV